jgi:RHS repeat-associated protein
LQNGILQNGLYNGNIASMTTQVHSLATLISPGATNDEFGLRANAYQYDQLNRLTHARSFDYTASSYGAAWVSRSSTINAHTYDALYSYDANGNIETANLNYGSSSAIDQLNYHYTKSSGFLVNNQLNYVEDLASTSATSDDMENQSSGNYTYDAIGNLVEDVKEEIDEIKWTVYGKVKEVIRTGGSTKDNLEFKYDASGQRVVKIVKPAGSSSSSWAYTYYLRDASGTLMSTYSKTGSGSISAGEVPIYGSSRLGEYKKSTGTSGVYSRFPMDKNYELSNHLGNVYVIISGIKYGRDTATVTNGSYVSATLDGKADYYFTMPVTAMDYMPFGSSISERKGAIGYRFGFNGKEKESEISEGDYDFDARLYDSKLGRWLSLDPLQVKYPYISPYHAMGNSPLLIVDQDGKENIIYIYVSPSAKKDPLFKELNIGDIRAKVQGYIEDVTGICNAEVKFTENLIAPGELDPTDSFVFIAGGSSSEAMNELNNFDNQYPLGDIKGDYMGGGDSFTPEFPSDYLERSTTNRKGQDGTEMNPEKWRRNLIGVKLKTSKEYADSKNMSLQEVVARVIWHGLGHNVTGRKHNDTNDPDDDGTFLGKRDGVQNPTKAKDYQIQLFKEHYGNNMPKDNLEAKRKNKPFRDVLIKITRRRAPRLVGKTE